MIVVLMGVTGSGKTTLGQLLAGQLGWTFVEGDAFHPHANVQKMHRGEPLTDADRSPWLRALRARIDELAVAKQSAVVACSALKQAYRDVLSEGRPEVVFVHLTAPAAVIRDRLDHRRGHFMPAALLDSQLATLEAPVGVHTVDVSASEANDVAAIRRAIGL
jgi:gluconokinase